MPVTDIKKTQWGWTPKDRFQTLWKPLNDWWPSTSLFASRRGVCSGYYYSKNKDFFFWYSICHTIFHGIDVFTITVFILSLETIHNSEALSNPPNPICAVPKLVWWGFHVFSVDHGIKYTVRVETPISTCFLHSIHLHVRGILAYK